MTASKSSSYHILIAGSGFSGSLTALALSQCGFHVCVVEKGEHPRFAIGESSTPVADMTLRALAVKYQLPWLSDFSRYGSWQQAHPEIVCGIKRGFSYYKHHPGKPFFTDRDHANELLVAASASDHVSDTNWLRADFDAFLVSKLKAYHIDYYDHTEILSAVRKGKTWSFTTSCQGREVTFDSSFFIDATGNGRLLHRLLSVASTTEGFLTHSFGLFSHLDNLPRWTERLHQKKIPTADYPFDPDHSALHHVLDEGWAWALRFNNGRTSWGFVLNGEIAAWQNKHANAIWQEMQTRYPDLGHLLQRASLSSQPGQIIQSGRLQRRLANCFGEGWVALPHTAGFVDPLFSTGIAYALIGIERIVGLLSEHKNFDGELYDQLKEYESLVRRELALIDLLVSGCYQTTPHFPLFNAWSMLYFAFTLLHENRRLHHRPVRCLLEADNPDVQRIAKIAYQELRSITAQKTIHPEDIARFTASIEERIRPYNTAGLLDPSYRHMYPHTAAE
jgi:FADH2 O2-dependent halogenase